MKKLVLVILVFMVLASSKGRVAWYGEREFEDTVKSLKEEGYTVEYITTIDEETLSVYDVLVLCLEKSSPEQLDVIMTFVEKGGGLLIIYDVVSYPEVGDVLSEYEIGDTVSMERDIIFPFLKEETVEDLKKRIAAAERGEGRIIAVGYDPITFQTVSLLLDLDNIFTFGIGWLCQDWHVELTQEILAEKRMNLLVPVAVVAVLMAAGYYVLKRKGKPGKVEPDKAEKIPKFKVEPDKAEKIRELKAKFVYGELSKEEYQEELEKLERSAK